MGMDKCKACGREFASTDPKAEICYPCQNALKRLNGYAVPVVRCKDCKHGIWDEDEQMVECILSVDLTGDADTYAMFHEYNNGEHFCSYGERRTDE